MISSDRPWQMTLSIGARVYPIGYSARGESYATAIEASDRYRDYIELEMDGVPIDGCPGCTERGTILSFELDDDD